MPLFCRHNRYLAECPICSKGTVFDKGRQSAPRPRSQAPRRSAGGRRPSSPPPGAARVTVGPFASAGPYERDDGTRYEVRLERVPGGVRVASWRGSELERRAPVLRAEDLPRMVAAAVERELLAPRDAQALERAFEGFGEHGEQAIPYGVSAGLSGEMREELRVEPLEYGQVRLGRWLHRPGTGEWELQDAAVMLPAARVAEALRSAVRGGVLAAT